MPRSWLLSRVRFSKRTLLSSGSAVPATHFTADLLLREGESRQTAVAAGKEHETHKERVCVSVLMRAACLDMHTHLNRCFGYRHWSRAHRLRMGACNPMLCRVQDYWTLLCVDRCNRKV